MKTPMLSQLSEKQKALVVRASQKDPVFFVEDILGSSVWDKQKEIIQALKTEREIAVRSNNAAGKTFVAARALLWWMYSGSDSVVITTAPTFRQVEQVLWREVRTAHRGSRILLGGEMLKTRLELDDNWFSLGLSSDSPENMQGFHSKRILVIVDEPSGVEDPIFEAIGGIMASGNATLLMIGNATKKFGYYANSFARPGVCKIHISAFDTPNFARNSIKSFADLTPENVQKAKLFCPGLVTPRWALGMIEKYGIDSDVVRVRVSGEFPVAEIDVLISIDAVAQAMERLVEVPVEAEEVIGLDPARYGDDSSACVSRKGNSAKILFKLQGQNAMEISGRFLNILRERKEAIGKIDIIGFGAAIYDRLKETDVADRVYGVNVAKPAIDAQQFKNLRAEGWQNAKEWLKIARLEKNDDWYQLCQPKYKILSNGQTQLESKEDMKKRGVSSPDVADALVLTLLPATEGGSGEIIWI